MMLASIATTQVVEDQILFKHSRKVQAVKPLIPTISSHKRSLLKSHKILPWSL
jgi:hypothetical protein